MTARRRSADAPVLAAAGALAAGVCAAGFWYARARAFDEDEFEHLHAAWCVFKGLTPYRDFFECHMPGLYYALAPLFHFFRVETDAGSALSFVALARALMWLVSCASLALVFRAGKEWRGARAGAAAAALLATTQMFAEKGLEARGDVPALALWLAGLFFLLKAARTGRGYAWSGLFVGLAALFTQKILFTFPGLALSLLACAAAGARRRELALFAAALAAPFLLACAWFAARGGLRDFLYFNFLFTQGLRGRITPFFYLLRLWEQNAFFCVCALLGAARLIAAAARRGASAAERCLAANLAGLLAGLFINPVPERQYFLLFLPLAALAAAALLVDACDRLAAKRSAWLLAGALAAAAVAPLRGMAETFRRGNADGAERIAYGLQNSAPGETIMEGAPTGLGLFRPAASFYFFLAPQVVPLVSEAEYRKLYEGLVSGAVAPKLISYDESLRRLPQPIPAWIEAHYAPAGLGKILKRRL